MARTGLLLSYVCAHTYVCVESLGSTTYRICHLQAKIFVLLFQFECLEFLFLFSLLWLVLPLFCWIELERMSTFALYNSWSKHFQFFSIGFQVSCRLYINNLSSVVRKFLFKSISLRIFYHAWILSFSKAFYASTEMIERVFFFYPTINNTENWVHCLLNMKPNLHFWIHYTWFIF